ncbi:MAG: hypothetical protein K6U87_11245 [Firmicutes bacterium]|nr:hypothetical protein [Bacillota bacterium]
MASDPKRLSVFTPRIPTRKLRKPNAEGLSPSSLAEAIWWRRLARARVARLAPTHTLGGRRWVLLALRLYTVAMWLLVALYLWCVHR